MQVVTKDEFLEWLEHPVTQVLKDRIRKDVYILQDMLIHTDLEGLKELQGRVKAAQNFLDMSYGDLYE